MHLIRAVTARPADTEALLCHGPDDSVLRTLGTEGSIMGEGFFQNLTTVYEWAGEEAGLDS